MSKQGFRVTPNRDIKLPLAKYTRVKAKFQGAKFVDVLYSAREMKCNILNLKGGKYMVLRTGEIKQKSTEKNLEIKKRSLNKTFNELRRLIRTNFTSEGHNQLFLTLTYRENMQDPEKLMVDFKNWIKKLKYNYSQHKFEYIAVAEPQGRGAWHIHLMLKSTNQEVLYLDYVKLSKMWNGEKGSVDGKKLGSSADGAITVDDIGSYYVAYFTNLEMDLEKAKNATDKRRNKGSRLKYYPPNFKMYRCSQGIKRPTSKDVTLGELEALGYEENYEKGYLMEKISDSGEITEYNRLVKATFSRKAVECPLAELVLVRFRSWFYRNYCYFVSKNEKQFVEYAEIDKFIPPEHIESWNKCREELRPFWDRVTNYKPTYVQAHLSEFTDF